MHRPTTPSKPTLEPDALRGLSITSKLPAKLIHSPGSSGIISPRRIEPESFTISVSRKRFISRNELHRFRRQDILVPSSAGMARRADKGLNHAISPEYIHKRTQF